MASILRSSKFVRYFVGLARHVVVNPPREFDSSSLNTANCLCAALTRSFANQTATQQDNLESSLRKLDQDVRRVGRISRQDIEEILEELRGSGSPTTSQSLMVIRCCGNLVPDELPEVRTKLVQEIWNTLLKLKVPVDVSHYNALLRVYLENEHPFSPTDVLAELEAKGIVPNRVTYQRLISRYCQVADIEGATRILEFMKEEQLPVNESVFNALIMGHSNAGDMESAQGILSVMAQAGLELGADTYTTLLCGYARAGDIEAINKTLQECDSKEIYFLDKDYLDVAYALIVNGHEEHVPLVLEKVRKAFGYNQDAMNTIFRLVNHGHENAAIAILKTMTRTTRTDGNLQQSGSFFIRHMIKSRRPIEKVLELCKLLEQHQLHSRALLLAVDTSLELGDRELAYPLLHELKATGQEIRQHFFWPLIVAQANDPTGEGIQEVLIEMNKFGLVPSAETLRDYVIPNLRGKPSNIIAKLRMANISLGSSSMHMVHSLLHRSEIEEAAIIISRVTAFYNAAILKRALTTAFYNTRNLDSYITIVRHVYENHERREALVNELEESRIDTMGDKEDVVGMLVLDLAGKARQFAEVAQDVFGALVEQGLSLKPTVAEKLQETLGEKLTPEISTLLGKLTSGELTPAPLERKSPQYTPAERMSIPQLERLIENLTQKNVDALSYKKQLLILYIREKDLMKSESLLKELEGNEITRLSSTYALLIDLYSYHNKVDEARDYYNKLMESDPAFKLDDVKILRLAGALIKSNCLDEGLELLNKHKHQVDDIAVSFSYSNMCWRILNSLAEDGRTEDLNTVFEALIKFGFVEATNVILGPLIKVHLLKDEVDAAVEKFEWCCTKYRATPWKNEIAARLIQMEDAEKLQKLTDLSTIVHGEINSLYDLVFAFVECGRIRQARKILETPGLQTRPQRINSACERYQLEGLVKPLEGLKDATKDLNHIDRSDIYYQLLLSYIKQEAVDKALGLWTQMQEEDVPPSDLFLYKLGSYLKDSKVEVPFTIPAAPADVAEAANQQQQLHTPRYSEVGKFRQAIKAGDSHRALEIMKSTREAFPVPELSHLTETLLQKDDLENATRCVTGMLKRNLHPVMRVFRFYLNKLAHAGDFQNFEKLSILVGDDVKKMISFDNKLCHAYLVSGQIEQYLQNQEQAIDNASESEASVLGDKFPRGGAFGILEAHPEHVDTYERIASKYAEKGVVGPMNVLWMYYLIKHNSKSEDVWNKHIQSSTRIMFQRVLKHARETSDTEMVQSLIDKLKTATVTQGALGNAYSCLLDVLCQNSKHEEAVAAFEQAIKDVPIESVNRTALIKVRGSHEKLGKPFNYFLPARIVNYNAEEEN